MLWETWNAFRSRWVGRIAKLEDDLLTARAERDVYRERLIKERVSHNDTFLKLDDAISKIKTMEKERDDWKSSTVKLIDERDRLFHGKPSPEVLDRLEKQFATMTFKNWQVIPKPKEEKPTSAVVAPTYPILIHF